MCQSPMPIAEYRALQERIRAQQPTECPECDSANIVPTFMDGGDWECLACFAWWTPEAVR